MFNLETLNYLIYGKYEYEYDPDIRVSLFLPVRYIYYFGLCCKKISRILNNEKLWKDISIREYTDIVLTDKILNWKKYMKEGYFEWDDSFIHGTQLKLSSSYDKQVNFIDKNIIDRLFYDRIGINSIVSKNIFKLGYTYTLITESYGEHPHMCFGLVSSYFNRNKDYVCSGYNGIGFSCSYISYSNVLYEYTGSLPPFNKKKIILIHHIDLIDMARISG